MRQTKQQRQQRLHTTSLTYRKQNLRLPWRNANRDSILYIKLTRMTSSTTITPYQVHGCQILFANNCQPRQVLLPNVSKNVKFPYVVYRIVRHKMNLYILCSLVSKRKLKLLVEVNKRSVKYCKLCYKGILDLFCRMFF